jgi:hypothetical protein
MLPILAILFSAILALIAYYDFKYRALPLYTLAIALIFGVSVSIYKNGFSDSIYLAGVNFLLIGSQLAMITLYFSIKNKKVTNIFNRYLGLGDILFFIVLMFCFSPVNFILFIVLSGILVLAFYIRSQKKELIPLAGCHAVLMIITLIFSIGCKTIQPYNDFFLIDLFYH